jgi:N-dimethylarginine dimethylaminohydrolase
MCPPRHFDVNYSINPWMDPTKPVDTGLALAQWERLREVYLSLGHQVEIIEPVPGLPDMVFAANGATVVDGRVLVARFRYPQRAAEARAYRDWFVDHGYRQVHEPEFVNEGEGDYLFDGHRLLAGTGFRTDVLSHGEARELFGRQVVGLRRRTAGGCCGSCTRTRSPPATPTPRRSASTWSPTGATW